MTRPVLALVAVALSCAPASPSSAPLKVVPTSVAVPAQPLDQIFDAELVQGAPVRVGRSALPAQSGGLERAVRVLKTPPAEGGTRAIHSALEQRVSRAERTGAAGELVDVVVTFREEIARPRFPSAIDDEPRSSPRNAALAAQAAQLVRDVQATRAPGHARRARELAADHGAAVREQFWLINALELRLPAGQIRALARRGDVVSVEEVRQAAAPPGDHSVDARALMNTDPYYNLGLINGFIGLLDTGADPKHVLLTNYGYQLDCVGGGATCDGPGMDPFDYANHGTSSASELSANSSLGIANRGVTGVLVDSFKVYDGTTLFGGTLNVTATLRGFQRAIAALDRVIVAEMQATTDENSAIASAADAAYDAGAVVIAAAGNYGPGSSSIACPGNARKALAIGALDVSTLALYDKSSRGPTADQRTKPDLMAPTNVWAAAYNPRDGANNLTTPFGGTSGATPNAAGAATLLRNFIRGGSDEFDPGQIYAMLINAGTGTVYPAWDNINGAGLVSLPVNGHLWWGAVTAGTTSGSMIDIPLGLSVTNQSLSVTIWWPESIRGQHNDVDLYVLNPSGVRVAHSDTGPGVWEKAQVPAGQLFSGTWTIRIQSYAVASPQRVYYAINFQ